ncbi:MAG: cytochrome c oxidase assembly protein [Candidatus Sumerlaeia bacterium]|nr:cytochrome c oxidase assembly protein [Candidatus Sumerlaeia bacterium]
MDAFDHNPHSETRPDRVAAKGTTRTLAILAVIGVGMFGFAFANAPLFVMICRKIGLIAEAPKQTDAVDAPDASRPLQVYFLANSNGLPVSFSVKRAVQDIAVGERAMNEYRFVNLSNERIYFRPVHDVSPVDAGRDEILHLEACFCFDEQVIEPRQEYVLPVIYRFDPALRGEVNRITMSYTLFLSDRVSYEKFHAARKSSAREAAEASDAPG